MMDPYGSWTVQYDKRCKVLLACTFGQARGFFMQAHPVGGQASVAW